MAVPEIGVIGMSLPEQQQQHDSVRLRPGVWQHIAIDLGIKATPAAMAAAAGISRATMYRAYKGEPVTAKTVAALVRVLGAPFEELFAVVSGDE